MATKLREAPKSNRYVVPDVKAEEAAIKKIWEAVDLIKEEKGKQIATDYINNTNRTEGAHADLKKNLNAASNLFAAYKSIDLYYREKGKSWKHQYDKETLAYDARMPQAKQARLAALRNKISLFAYNAIRDELSYLNPLNTLYCRCPIRIHFNLPCCHRIPPNGEIPLSLVPRRWHLFPEETATGLETIDHADESQHNSSDIIAITNPPVVPTILDEINAELTRIEHVSNEHSTGQHRHHMEQQLQPILEQLKNVKNDDSIDLEHLLQPKSKTNAKGNTTRSTKRGRIGLEIHEDLAKKKAKTLGLQGNQML
ncbi:predicted protein [Lichtheimia corymbifera JMRC:FSU:9682]|uniref:SWIM-type domain-containing protein n=1 Tax=Lichtheimia corymbifera JMRC:FSU:9682 TaxID=1263082 RepID=A0A068SA43_9FUNG|nr:predicted protein [Lichtheimia corymbifera JMRC:FSU:9682]